VAGEQRKKLYSYIIYIFYKRGSKKANTKSIGLWRFLQRGFWGVYGVLRLRKSSVLLLKVFNLLA